MDIFGFTPAELTTPLGGMIKSATDSLRIGPDWTLSLEICDIINRNPRENIEPAFKALRRRLQDNDHHTVYLSIILLETCTKNCGDVFVGRFDRGAMEDMVNIARGNKGVKNADEALRIIQQWARAFESRRSAIPIFYDTYMNLKTRGISFPREDAAATKAFETSFQSGNTVQHGSTSGGASNTSTSRAIAAPVPASSPAPITSIGSPSTMNEVSFPSSNDAEFEKLQNDLVVVMEKVKLCREMLLVSPGILHDEALAEVIGFLEACRDRLTEVIEAGTQGLLGELLFAHCLKVNDAVYKTLEAERSGTKIDVEEDEVSSKSSDISKGVNLLDLDGSNSPVRPKVSLQDEIFGLGQSTGATTTSSSAIFAPSSTVAPSVSEPFDPFKLDSASQVQNSYYQTQSVAISSPSEPLPTPPQKASSVDAPSVNPFDENFSPPPAPEIHIQGAAMDDFDVFLNTSSANPAHSTTTTSNQPHSSVVDQDFDSFLASLEKK